jgi:TP901 family phage tail tape measure protein
MVAKVTNPAVTAGFNAKPYEAGAERVSLSTKRMLAIQEAADRKYRAMVGAHAAALREQESREKAIADAVERAEKRKQEAREKTAKVVAAGSTAILAGLTLAAREAVGWESAWAGVTKTVDGTHEQMQALEGDLRAMARTLPATHQEIAAVAEAAGQLGVKREDVAGFTRTVIDLSETTNLTADEAATSLAQFMNIMQTAPENVGRLGAALVELGNNGASTERDIVQMSQRIAGAGRVVGLTEAQVLAIANAVASVGIEVEAGGSAISNVLTDMAKSVATSSEDLSTWARVSGMTADQFVEAWRQDPAAALDAFIQGLGAMNAAGEDVFTTLSDLGQSDVRVSRALLSMAGAGDLLSRSLAMGNDAWQENTALVEEAAKRYDTAESRLQVARNSVKDTAITIGETFLPMIAKGADAAASFAQWVGELPEPTLQWAAAAGTVAATLGLVTSGVVLTLPKLVEFKKTLDDLRQTAPRTAGAIGTIGKAAAVAASVYVLVEGMRALRSVTDEVTASTSETTKALIDARDIGDIDKLFQFDDRKTAEVKDFASAIELVAGGGFWNGVRRATSGLGEMRTGVDELAASRTQLDAIGNGLSALVQAGNAEEAGRIFGWMADEAAKSGVGVEQLKDALPAYRDALADADAAQQLAADSADGLTARYNAATDATQELTEEQLAYLKAISDTDAAMVSVGGAYQAGVDKAREAAQAKADAWNKSAAEQEKAAKKEKRELDVSRKSWEDYYDGVTVSFDEYLAQLQAQVETQSRWEENLLTLSTRGVSQQTLDALRSQGVDFAPMLDQIAKGSDEQVAKLDELYGNAGSAATSHFADMLTNGTPVLQAAGEQLGQDAVDAIVKRMTDGKTTLQQIIDEYALIVEGMPTTAQRNADEAQRRYDEARAAGRPTSFADVAGALGLGSAGVPAGIAAPPAPTFGPPTPPTFGPPTPKQYGPPSPGAGVGPSWASGPSSPFGQVQVLPVPIETRIDQSTVFNGPATFTDPGEARSTAAAARANTAGRRAIGGQRVAY